MSSGTVHLLGFIPTPAQDDADDINLKTCFFSAMGLKKLAFPPTLLHHSLPHPPHMLTTTSLKPYIFPLYKRKKQNPEYIINKLCTRVSNSIQIKEKKLGAYSWIAKGDGFIISFCGIIRGGFDLEADNDSDVGIRIQAS